MPTRQRLVKHRVISFLVCSALLVTACSQEKVSKRTVPFNDLLTLRREVPLVTADSSLAVSSYLTLTPQPSGFVASDGHARRQLDFDSTGHCTGVHVLDTLAGPQCMGRRLLCAFGHDGQVYSYDPVTNSVYRRARGEFARIPLNKWRVDRWGANERRIIALGPRFPEAPPKLSPQGALISAPEISVRTIEGLEITPVCSITQDLEYPHLYHTLAPPNAICAKEDDGFYVLEAASMRILEYSPRGELLRRSSEVPEGFIPPSADSSYMGNENQRRVLGYFTMPVSFGRIGKYLLVFWVERKEPSLYLEVYDENLHLRLTKIKASVEYLDPTNMFTRGNSLFLTRQSGTCRLPSRPAQATKPQKESPPVLVEFTFNDSIIEHP